MEAARSLRAVAPQCCCALANAHAAKLFGLPTSTLTLLPIWDAHASGTGAARLAYPPPPPEEDAADEGGDDHHELGEVDALEKTLREMGDFFRISAAPTDVEEEGVWRGGVVSPARGW